MLTEKRTGGKKMSGYDVQYDVIICGGGTSGVAAAVSAVREGAKTGRPDECLWPAGICLCTSV